MNALIGALIGPDLVPDEDRESLSSTSADCSSMFTASPRSR